MVLFAGCENLVPYFYGSELRGIVWQDFRDLLTLEVDSGNLARKIYGLGTKW